jgi:hypothetical protein
VPDNNQKASIQVKEYKMKTILKSLAVAVVLAASHSALSYASPFPSSGEAIDRALPALDTYADWHARNGTLMGSKGSPFPSSAEPIDSAPAPVDTYADRHARNGTLMAGSGSPFPGNGDPVALAPFDTYADRYARESAAPTSAELDADKQSIVLGGRS